MGTRNLTIVYMNGEYRVAQYGQWDGYPEGQGLTCLHFLRDKLDEKTFKHNLMKLHFADDKKLKALAKEFGASEDGTIRMDDYARFKKAYPELHRDTGAKILEMIQDGSARILQSDINFAADSLFCEWAYIVDFDKRTFEVYEGFNKTPLEKSDRFYFLREYEDADAYGNYRYYGVKLAKEFSLDDLPEDDEFLDMFKVDDEED